MDRVGKKASNDISTVKTANGEADFGEYQKIYTRMQCTLDLSHKDCDSCLSLSISYFKACCHGKKGGYVRRPNCYFRWELYPFYTSNATPPPSPFSSPPHLLVFRHSQRTQIQKVNGGGSSSKAIVIIIVPIVILVVVLVILVVVVVLKRIKKIKQDNQNGKSRVESLQFDFNAVKVATENFSNIEGTAWEVVDPILRDGLRSEIMGCIHLRLLCVQDNIAYRPTMASVVLMLSSYSMSLPVPSRPAFSLHSTGEKEKKPDSVPLFNQSKGENPSKSLPMRLQFLN
ncbi:hypothetical protein Gotur_018002 [Gossypium turneri]